MSLISKIIGTLRGVFSLAPLAGGGVSLFTPDGQTALQVTRSTDGNFGTRLIGSSSAQVPTNLILGGTTAVVDDGNARFKVYNGITNTVMIDSASINLLSTGVLKWSTTTAVTGTNSVGLSQPANGVLKVTNGSSGNGWLQNAAARARNTAAVTNATATMANLADMTITLIAGRKYFGRMVLFANNSTAAEGLQFDFNGGTATFTSIEFGFAATPPGAGLALGTLTSTAAGTAIAATTATTGDAVYTVEFSLVCSAGGTLIPRFAEVSHATGTATVQLGSWLLIEDSPL